MGEVFHVSEEEAARDFSAVLARAYVAGSIVIDCTNGGRVLLQIQSSAEGNSTNRNTEDFIPGRTVERPLLALLCGKQNTARLSSMRALRTMSQRPTNI